VLADRIVEWELSAPLSRNCTRLVRDRAGVCWWGDGYPSGHAWIPLSLPSRQLDPGRPCTTCGTRSLVALGPEDEPRFLCAGCLLQEGRMRHDGAPPLGRTRRHEPGQWDFHPVDRLARMAVLATLEPPFTCAWCGVTDDLAGLFLYDDAAWWVCRSCWTPKPDDGLAGVLARL
jgi:hypothetical protein